MWSPRPQHSTIVLCVGLLLLQYSYATAMTSHTNKTESLRIYCVTWNVATKSPEQDIHSLLNLIRNDEAQKKLPDMYIAGLQEVRSQPQDLVMNIFTYDPWTQEFRDVLRKYDYVKIGTMKMQGIIISAFSLRKHVPYVRLMEMKYTKTGLNGFWGNKGAVSIRMNLYGINICFLNAHMPAHDNALQNRIDDYETIMKTHVYENMETKHIVFHDYVFWIGDLNFRLTEGLSASDIALLIKNNELETLLAKDQLLLVKNKQEAFSEFTEEKITFPPTYKYEFASQEFDLKRRPSWTDRILYKVNKDAYSDSTLAAVQLNYRSHPFYVQSDHKPVTAEFDIKIRPNKSNEMVELIVPTWCVDEENTVSYRYLGGYEPDEKDYIALFHDKFDSIDEYIVYEYVKAARANEEESTENVLYFSFAASKTSGLYRLVYFSEKQSALSILGISDTFRINERNTETVQMCN